MANWSARLVKRLASVTLPNVFNPYSDRCDACDLPDAPIIRSANLRTSLEVAQLRGAKTIWFGRDFGYRGGRRTGISLTDEVGLDRLQRLLPEAKVRQATVGPPIAERTATVIWSVIDRMSAPPILWNAFPLHPHLSADQFSNRAHTASERRVTAWSINLLLDEVQPSTLIAIGNDAAFALTELGLPFEAVRHPSYGGQRDFLAGMERILGLGTPSSQAPSPLLDMMIH